MTRPGKHLAIASRAAVAAALSLIAVGLLAAPARAVTAQEAVDLLNAQRRANGLPANIVENPEWSAACAQHNHYMEQTGDFAHEEDPASPFYSAEGAWAGQHSVLSLGDDGWPANSPWATAPIHLYQLLYPGLDEMGVDVTDSRYACATTWPGYRTKSSFPESLVTYSYPGDGVSGVPPSETAAEHPFIPGDFVGLPQGTTTGPYLYVFLDGPSMELADASVADASLRGDSGAVEVRVVDSSDPQVGPYMPPAGAFVIPVHPLEPQTTYRASVTFQAATQTATRNFSFTTGGSGKAKAGPGRKAHGARKSARLRLRAALKGRRVSGRVRFARGDRGRLRVVARCRAGRRFAKRLRLRKRRAASARFAGRVKPCRRLRVVASIGKSPGYRPGHAAVSFSGSSRHRRARGV